jgi:hypothetical protein
MEVSVEGMGATVMMTRWKQRFAEVVVIAVTASGMAFAQLREKSSTGVASLQSGEYLNQKYVKRLEETGSPHSAYLTGSPQLVIVEQQADGTHLTPIFNFHEGGPRSWSVKMER